MKEDRASVTPIFCPPELGRAPGGVPKKISEARGVLEVPGGSKGGRG